VSETHRVAPWWVGYLLLSPLRRWIQDPARILGPLVGPGQTVLEVGPAMGFFTLPLARLVGPAGRVIAVDCQERMLGRLRARAKRAGLPDRIDARCCSPESLAVADLRGQVDFALAFSVLHEAAEPARMIGEMAASLRAGSRGAAGAAPADRRFSTVSNGGRRRLRRRNSEPILRPSWNRDSAFSSSFARRWSWPVACWPATPDAAVRSAATDPAVPCLRTSFPAHVALLLDR
jgi:SAM-dependent methyltransferase